MSNRLSLNTFANSALSFEWIGQEYCSPDQQVIFYSSLWNGLVSRREKSLEYRYHCEAVNAASVANSGDAVAVRVEPGFGNLTIMLIRDFRIAKSIQIEGTFLSVKIDDSGETAFVHYLNFLTKKAELYLWEAKLSDVERILPAPAVIPEEIKIDLVARVIEFDCINGSSHRIQF